MNNNDYAGTEVAGFRGYLARWDTNEIYWRCEHVHSTRGEAYECAQAEQERRAFHLT